MKFLSKKRKQGSALIVTLITCGVIATVLASYLVLLASRYNLTARSMAWNSAIPVLESGIEEALTHLQSDSNSPSANGWNSATIGGQPVVTKRRDFADGSYAFVWIANAASANPMIYSSGFVPAPFHRGYISRTVSVTTSQVGNNGGGLVAKGKITFSGGGSLDSFNSLNGPYNPTNRSANGRAISMAGVADAIHVDTAYIYGSATTAPGGTITVNSGAVGDVAWNASNSGIQGGHSGNDANVQFDPVIMRSALSNALAPPTNVTIGGTNYSWGIGAGDWKYTGNINIGGGKSMVVYGDASLYMNGDFVTSGSGFVYVAPGASLKLYVRGQVKVSGTGVVNGTQRAERLSVYGLSTSSSDAGVWSGGSAFIGTVYMPFNPFTFSGGAGAFGSFTASTITISGGAAVHYDESLGGQPSGLTLMSYREIN